MPAAFCGVVGVKPTHGRISLRGANKIAWSMDHAGPFGRTVADARIIFDALVDRPRPASRTPGRCPVIAVVEGSIERATPAVGTAVESALTSLERAGARVVETLTIAGIEQHLPAFMITMIGEASLGFEELLRDRADGISPKIRASLELGSQLRAADYVRPSSFARCCASQSTEPWPMWMSW